MPLEGQQIDRYRIVRLLGSGGMGDVYLAEDARIEQQVAIKVMRAEASPYPDAQASQEATRLFQREAKAIAKLDHPRILPLYDYGEQRLGNTTLIYLVMPYRPEGSLVDWLRQRGQGGLLAAQDVAHFVHQAASALQHAHHRQIIHQDVKPSNFLIHSNEEDAKHPDVLLADFGVAKFTSATASMSHTIRGTPTYMAPEQWSGEPVPATDQYALAVMAYELLTGRPPFQGGERQVMYQHLMVPPTPPSSLNPRLSKDIDTVLLHALAKKPEERFASISAFANAFQQAAQSMQEAPAPTRKAAAPRLSRSSDLRAVLAISTTEAQTGTSRTLNLPGGRKVTVPVPEGIQNGQIVRLDGQGEPAGASGEAGALILTIKVEAAEALPPFAVQAAEAEPTVFTASTARSATNAPTARSTSHQPTESRVDPPEVVTPPSPPAWPSEALRRTSQPMSEVAPSPRESAQPARSEQQVRQRDSKEETPPPDDLPHTVGRVTCPFCATENAPEEAFCVSCGFALKEQVRKAEVERLRKVREEHARKAEVERFRKAREEQARKATNIVISEYEVEEELRKAREEQVRKAEEEQLRKAREEQTRKAEEERLRSTPASVSVPALSASPTSPVSPQTPQRREGRVSAGAGWTGFGTFALTVGLWVLLVFYPYHGNLGVLIGGLVAIVFQLLLILVAVRFQFEIQRWNTFWKLVGMAIYFAPLLIAIYNNYHA